MLRKFKNKFTVIIIMSTILSILFSCDNSEIVQKTSEKIFEDKANIEATVDFLVKATVESIEKSEKGLINSVVRTIRS